MTQDQLREINIEVVYYIFRHAQTKFSKTRTPYGSHENTAEILKEGIPAIKHLADELKNIQSDKNFSSEILRCVQTTAIVSKISGKKFVFDSRLDEFIEDNFNDFKSRIKNFIDYVEDLNLKSTIICTHGAGIAALKHLILEDQFTEENLADYPFPGVLVKIENKIIKEIDFN